MIPALALALFAAVPSSGGAEAVEARFLAEPAAVEVGEPFELTLELEHPASSSLAPEALGLLEPALDDSWVVLSARRAPTERFTSPSGAEHLRLRRTWTVVSLEPGERELPAVVLSLPIVGAEAGGAAAAAESGAEIEVAALPLTVRGVLAEGEDDPRPLRDFQGLGSTAGDASPAWLRPASIITALVALAVTVLLVRRRRGALVASGPAPLERLTAIEGEAQAGGVVSTSAHFELSRLLRETADRRLGRDLDGLTDEEWLAVFEASAAGRDLKAAYAQLMPRLAEVKYAGERPSSWALESTFGEARRALELAASEPGRGGS